MRRQDVKIKDIIFRITSIICEPQFLKHIERTRTSEQHYIKKKIQQINVKNEHPEFLKIPANNSSNWAPSTSVDTSGNINQIQTSCIGARVKAWIFWFILAS